MMDFETYDRKPFPVKAAQVTPQNAEAIAEKTGGLVVMVPTRMIGATVDMPAVQLPAAKDRKPEVAEIGHWVVERKGVYRAYKPQAFSATFVQRREEPTVAPPLENSDVDPAIAEMTPTQFEARL